MMNLKKVATAIVAVAAIATVFTGCGNKKNIETLKGALESSANMESGKMAGDITISVLEDVKQEEGAENVTNTATMPLLGIEMESTIMDKGFTNATTMTMSMLGMGGIEQQVYMKDGVTYTSLDGGQTFITQPLEETAGMDLAKMKELSAKYNKKFLDGIDFETVEFEEKEEGLSAKFSVPSDLYKDIFKEVMNEMYPNGMDEYIRTETTNNLLAMGITEEELAAPELQEQINQSVEMATKMVNVLTEKLTFNKFDVKVLITDSVITKMDYDMELDLKPIVEAMGEQVPEMAQALPESMRVGVKASMNISELNAVTAIDFPEFTEENTLTMEEMMQMSMEEAAALEDMAGAEQLPAEDSAAQPEVAPAA